MNRREVFAVLAGLPLIGLLFGQKTSEAVQTVPTMYINGDESRPVKPGESVYLSGGTQTPSIHIPNEDGSITCVPIGKNFSIYYWDERIENGPTPVNFLMYIDGKLSKTFLNHNNNVVFTNQLLQDVKE